MDIVKVVGGIFGKRWIDEKSKKLAYENVAKEKRRELYEELKSEFEKE